MSRVVIDAAGGTVGGAARWRTELDAFLSTTETQARVIGHGRRLTGAWLVGRESLAAGSETVVASNNASFAVAGRHRRVLLHNALHFLYPAESQRIGPLTLHFHTQIRLVRTLCQRADVLVVPCGDMAARVAHHLPSARERIAVRHHPVTPVGPRTPVERPFILTPVLPAPYKNLFPQLRLLVTAMRRSGRDLRVIVTTEPARLPADLAGHPRITTVGVLPHLELAEFWRTASAVFFPSVLEAFGYPLAEARAYGVPIIAPDNAQSREIAGSALIAYQPTSVHSLAAALERVDEPVTPDPEPFDRDRYFQWLLGGPAG